MRRSLALLAVAVLAACGGGNPEQERAVPPLREPPARLAPSTALRAAIRAAAAGNAVALKRLVAGTPAAPALASLARGLRGFGRSGYEVVLDEEITSNLGIVAVMHGDRAFAAALRFQGDRWKVLLPGRVRIHPVRPQPEEDVKRRTQLAAGVEADVPLDEAGLWFDGLAFESRGGGTGPSNLTLFGEAPQPLPEGWHIVIAFASAGREAAALAWTFFVSEAGS